MVEIKLTKKQIQDVLVQLQEKQKKSKQSHNKCREESTVIFDRWNFYKGKKKWKSHKELSYEIEQAINEQLKHYTVEALCGAIDNYAKVLLSPEFKWSCAWTLQQFLTRTLPHNRKEQQLWRFLPNNYHDDDYLTDSAKKTRISEARNRQNAIERDREKKESEESSKKVEEMRKKIRAEDGPKYRAMTIEQLKAILKDRLRKEWITRGWLIKEIIAEKEQKNV